MARRFAGEDGLILRVRQVASKEVSSWKWGFSDDAWLEHEVFLKGPRSGDIEIFRP